MRHLLLLSAWACFGAHAAEPCFSAAAHVERSAASPTRADMQAFLRTFSDPRCKANTEYAESGNEMIFDAIEHRPALFFGALFALTEPEIAAVRAEIGRPVHDCIHVARRVEAVRRSHELPEALKRRALGFLAPAERDERAMIAAWEARNNRKWSWGDCAP